jgi:hypothetical protein
LFVRSDFVGFGLNSLVRWISFDSLVHLGSCSFVSSLIRCSLNSLDSLDFVEFIVVRCSLDSLVRWFVSSLVRWFVGSLVRFGSLVGIWFVGFVGSLVQLFHWFVGSLEFIDR